MRRSAAAVDAVETVDPEDAPGTVSGLGGLGTLGSLGDFGPAALLFKDCILSVPWLTMSPCSKGKRYGPIRTASC